MTLQFIYNAWIYLNNNNNNNIIAAAAAALT